MLAGDTVPHWQDDVLSIEPATLAHLDFFIALRANAEVQRFTGRVPFASREQASEFLQQKVLDECTAGRACNWMIRERASGELIGNAGIWRIDRANDSGEVGYVLLPAFWGRGYAARALAPMLDHVFKALGLHRVEAHIDSRNRQSAVMVQKLGFCHEATLRENYKHGDRYLNSEIYALLDRDWCRRQG